MDHTMHQRLRMQLAKAEKNLQLRFKGYISTVG